MKCLKSPTPYLLFLGVLFTLSIVKIPTNNTSNSDDVIVTTGFDQTNNSQEIAFKK